MKKLLILLIVTVFVASCVPEMQNKHLTYQNIVILTDMSNRIQNKKFPQKDCTEIHNIVQYFKNDCVKPGKKIGDKSSICFSVFSEKNSVAIDLEKMKSLADKQSFINSTGKYKTLGLDSKLKNFEDSVKIFYGKISNPGLDLISLLIEKINNDDIIKKNKLITDGIDTTYINFDNHIYIFTDGYLEYNFFDRKLNGQYYFGFSEIQKVRNYCIANGVNVATALEKNKSLSLPNSENEQNKYVNLHILETQERDKDIKFQIYRHPKGLRDNEILEAVWKKWAKGSGFKSIEWKKY